MVYPYCASAWTLDSTTLTFVTLGLGSTAGLIVVARLGLANLDGGINGNGSYSVRNLAILTIPNSVYRFNRLIWIKPVLAKVWRTLSLVVQLARITFVGLLLTPYTIVRTLKKVICCFHKTYGKMSWRKLGKLLRIFYIWEPLPHDFLVGQRSSTCKQVFEDKRDEGFVGVCLRFRCGTLQDRINGSGTARELYGQHVSLDAYLPLEGDGSLRVDLIRDKFHIDEVELLVPGRWQSHRVTKGDVISKLKLHELTQRFNCVNVVEYEDVFCQHRRRFRQWFRGTRLHYAFRVFCYFCIILTFVYAGLSGATQFSSLYSAKSWWYFSHTFSYLISASAVAIYFEHRKQIQGPNTPWHTLPERYSRYLIPDRFKGRFM